jgi:hypothetical protein
MGIGRDGDEVTPIAGILLDEFHKETVHLFNNNNREVI